MSAQDCDSTVYIIVQQMPEYPGGPEEMYNFLADLTYPTVNEDEEIISKFYIKFTVNCDGSLSDFQALKHKEHPLSVVVINHLKRMPNWTPGEQNGKLVRVSYTLPINIHWN